MDASPTIAAPAGIKASPVEVRRMSLDLLDARNELVSAGTNLPFDGNEVIHRRLNDLINEVDEIRAIAKRGGQS